MEKSRIIYYVILLSVILYIFFPRNNCEKFKKEYNDIALDIRIEKMSKPQNHMEIEGYDTDKKYIKWVDKGTLLLINNEKMVIGNHIIKVKGDSIFRIYRSDSLINIFHYTCSY